MELQKLSNYKMLNDDDILLGSKKNEDDDPAMEDSDDAAPQTATDSKWKKLEADLKRIREREA